MKKFLMFLSMAMLCVLPFILKTNVKDTTYAVSTKQEQSTNDDKKWDKEDLKELFAYVGVGIGGIGTALSVAIPIYIKIKKAQIDLKDATTGLTNAREKNKKLAEELEFSKNEQRREKSEFIQKLKSYDETFLSMSKKLQEIESICKLGFINNKELVAKGIATEISKVGQDEEIKK